MKIFISGIDSELGYHLTESLRQDHFLLQGYSLISGTVTTPENLYMLHESVHMTFDFSKQRDMTVKSAVESDVVILDLRNDSAPEIEFILKVLKHYNVKKPVKVIGISNFTTWSNSKSTQFSSIPHEKELLLEYSLNKQNWQPSHLNKDHYPLRVPHPMFVYNYLLEEQILQLKNSNELIQPIVLCSGVIYGKSGFDLRVEIQQAVKGEDNWMITMKHDNQVEQEATLPVLHVDKLLGKIEEIVYENVISKDSNPNHQEYNVLCEDQPKSIVKLIQMANQICGNMKQLHEQKQNDVKPEKPPATSLKLPSPNNELTLPINNQSINSRASSRAIRYSTGQSRVGQIQSSSFIPELTFAKDKRKFALLMNLKFFSKDQDEINNNQREKIKNPDDTLISDAQDQGMEGSMVKVKDNVENDVQVKQKQWVESIIEEFTEYYECEFRQFLFAQELLKTLSQDQQIGNKAVQNILNRYFVINDKVLSDQLNILISNGVITQERLTTPEEEKKKPNSKNSQNKQVTSKQPYEIVFPQVIRHVMEKKKLSHFVINLKSELILKMLSLFNQPEYQTLKSMNFINLVSKDSMNTSQLEANENISKSIEIFSDEFNSIFGIQTPKDQNLLKGQTQLDKEEQINIAQKTRKVLIDPKDISEESQEPKINLMSQYLLDNLIVYLAEAKQQLKMKGKLKLGQKFEGKQNIKLFIEELKQIKARELKLVCDEEE